MKEKNNLIGMITAYEDELDKGIIRSNEIDYLFLIEDVENPPAKVGSEVNFRAEKINGINIARFVNIKNR